MVTDRCCDRQDEITDCCPDEKAKHSVQCCSHGNYRAVKIISAVALGVGVAMLFKYAFQPRKGRIAYDTGPGEPMDEPGGI